MDSIIYDNIYISNRTLHHPHMVDVTLWGYSLPLSICLYLQPHIRLWHTDLPEQSDYTPPPGVIPYDEHSILTTSSIPIFTCDDELEYLNANNNATDTTGSTTLPSNKEVIKHSLVVNLSSFHLNQESIDILSKGTKFCPTPGEPDVSKAYNDLESFHLKLKRFLHFTAPPRDDNVPTQNTPTNNAGDPNAPFKDRKFKNPSAWAPPPCIPLEVYIAQNKSDLLNSKFHAPRRQKITKEQRLAIKALQSNKNIVIKPADKGGAMVILNREDYVREGLRQLSDINFYCKTDTDLSNKHHTEIKNKIDEMLENEEIDRSCADYLCNPEFRTSEFYMLPKIHKRLENPPGRPIVSGNGCPTERISQFVDYFLKPIVQNTTSYIKDTTHFLSILRDTGRLPDNTLLVTLDVSSLYTNIPNDLGIQACKEQLSNYRTGSNSPTNDSIISLLEMVLSKNNFNFNNEHYLQVGGTAMGTKLAPSYANIFMDYFERTFVYTYEVQPLLWKRYIDDIFVLWTAGAQTLTSFVEYLDNCLPSMKFEANISDSTINFLDVRATIKENTITTSLYTKETDTLSYLDYSSCHPKSCKNGIPYSQFLRLRRICSEDEDFVLQSEKLALSFHRANYPDNVIQSSFDKAFNIDRESLFQRGPSTNNNQKDDPKLFLITDFHPSYRAVLDIVSQNWDMLDNSSSTRPLLHIPVIRGFRRPKNIRDLLVRAKLTQPDSNGVANTNPRTRRKKCTRFNCTYCKCIDKSGKIICPFNKRTYISRYNVSCISNNLVYGLYCKVCHKIYVGQTKRELRARIGEHFTSIRKHKKHLVVGRHYNSAGHTGINNVIVYALEFVTTHPDAPLSKKRRESCEQKWIFRLRSYIPLGLNLTE